ncbi:MAG: tetratricopeptide repeat protein, partial [Bryobacteraceae bacterium]|nr:tetratricopeptide repeat protein [Bryobacteraceae bacterium]
MKQESPPAWVRLGLLLGRKADYAAAHEAFAKAESLYNTSGNLAGVTEVNVHRAAVLMLQGQVQEAQLTLEKALKLANTTGFESQRIRILMRHGVLSRLNEDSVEAERYASEALALANENRMEQYTVDGLMDLGNVYLQKRDLPNAEKHYSSALRIARSLNSRIHEARAVASIASVRSLQSRLDDARAGAEKALAFYRSAGYQREMVSVLTLLAQIRTLAGDFTGALAAFEEQLKLTEPSNARAVASMHLRIGIALLNLERFSESLNHLDAALSAPDSATRAYAALNRAEVLVATGDISGARQILANEKDLEEPTQMVVKRAAAVKAMASFQEGRYQDAVRQSAAAARRLGDSDTVLASRIRALEALAVAHAGDTAAAQRLCDKISSAPGDLRTSAITALRCAEVQLLAGKLETARSLAARAGNLFAQFGQPEAQWRACTLEASALGSSDSAARNAECDNIRNTIPTRWGKQLWDRYLTRPDVTARLARVARTKPQQARLSNKEDRR